MSADTGGIPQAFMDTWQLLPAEQQDAYMAHIQMNKARVMLGFGAVINAVEGRPPTAENIHSLEASLDGLYLSEIVGIADTVESLATQMKLPPYVRQEVAAEVHPFPLRPALDPDLVPAPADSGTAVPAEAAPADAPEPEPVSEPVAPAPEIPEAAAAEPEASPVLVRTAEQEPPINRRQLNALQQIFGNNLKEELQKLTAAEAVVVCRIVGEVYLANNKRKEGAQRQLRRWQRHLQGEPDSMVALEENVSDNAISQGRAILYGIVRKANLSLPGTLTEARQRLGREPIETTDDVQTQAAPTATAPAVEPSTPAIGEASTDILFRPPARPSETPVQPIASDDKSSEPTELIESGAEAAEKLRDELLVLGDSLGMSGRMKRELAKRFDETNQDPILTKEAKEALMALANKYARLAARGLELGGLERKVIEALTGRDPDDSTVYPLPAVKGMLHDEIQKSGKTVTALLLGVIQKINSASRANVVRS